MRIRSPTQPAPVGSIRWAFLCVQGCPEAQLRCLWRTGPVAPNPAGATFYNQFVREHYPPNVEGNCACSRWVRKARRGTGNIFAAATLACPAKHAPAFLALKRNDLHYVG